MTYETFRENKNIFPIIIIMSFFDKQKQRQFSIENMPQQREY